MSRSKTSLSGLFAHLLRPVTSAIEAETGRTLTAPQWGRILRSLAARSLRTVAKWIEPQPEPAPVAIPTPEPTATPEPAAVPHGWASLDIPELPADLKPAPTVATYTDHDGYTSLRIEEPAPVATARKRSSKPKAKPAPSAARVTAPTHKPAKAPGKAQAARSAHPKGKAPAKGKGKAK